MANCKDCIHYGICTFHVTGKENEKFTHYTPTADAVPKSELHDDHHKQVACYTLGCREGDKIRREVAREIFEEIEKHRDKIHGIALLLPEELAELKKKYTEG